MYNRHNEESNTIINSMMIGTNHTIGQTTERKLHDVSVFYGTLPFTDRGFWEKAKYESIGIFSAQYIFNTSKRFGISTIMGYQHYSHRHSCYSANDITGMIVVRGTVLIVRISHYTQRQE